jgi:hypothetical protein
LRQITRGVRVVSGEADLGVDGIPVPTTQGLECLPRLGTVGFGRGENEAPLGRGELSRRTFRAGSGGPITGLPRNGCILPPSTSRSPQKELVSAGLRAVAPRRRWPAASLYWDFAARKRTKTTPLELAPCSRCEAQLSSPGTHRKGRSAHSHAIAKSQHCRAAQAGRPGTSLTILRGTDGDCGCAGPTPAVGRPR